MDRTNRKWIELLIIKLKVDITIILDVIIEDKINHYTLKNNKLDLIISSNSNSIEAAKQEFNDYIVSLLNDWTKRGVLKDMLTLCGFNLDKATNHFQNIYVVNRLEAITSGLDYKDTKRQAKWLKANEETKVNVNSKEVVTYGI